MSDAPPPSYKWVGLPFSIGGAEFQTTIFYGPWKCRQDFINSCIEKCAGEGHAFKGCMWLADVKKEFRGRFLVRAGGRLAVTHCCCDYPTRSVDETEDARDEWDGARDKYRQDWAKEYGDWPRTGDDLWPGHHVRDLKHGGDPKSGDIIPMAQKVHSRLNRLYNQCYAGQGDWNTAGPYSEED